MLMSKEEIPDIFRTLVRLLNNASTNRAVQVDVGEGFVFHRRELDVLLMVGDKPGISQSAIAQNIGVPRAVVYKIVKNLVARGLVEFDSDPDDGRRASLRPSSMRERALAAHHRYHQERDRDFLDYINGLDEQQQAVISEFLARASTYNQIS